MPPGGGMVERSSAQRRHWPAAIVPLLLFAEQMALGANGPILALIASGAEIAAALCLLWLLQPPAAFWMKGWPVLLALLLAFLWLFMPALAPPFFAWAPVRPVPDLTLPGVVRWLGGASMLLAGAWLGFRRGAMRHALDVMMGLGVVAILVGFAMRQYDPDHIWGQAKAIAMSRFTGTLLNANAQATLAAITALLGTGGLLVALRTGGLADGASQSRAHLFFSAAACVGGLGACVGSGSRTILVATVAAMLLLAGADRRLRQQLWSRHGLVIGATVTIAILLLSLGASDLTLSRFEMLESASIVRGHFMTHYAGLVLKSPWIGYGPLSFDQVNQANMGDPAGAMTFWYVHSPHNVILSLLMAGGFPYLLLLVAAIVMAGMQVVRHRRADRSNPMLRAAVAGIGVIAVGSLVDIQADVPVLSSTLCYLAAMIWGRALRVAVDGDAASSHPAVSQPA